MYLFQGRGSDWQKNIQDIWYIRIFYLGKVSHNNSPIKMVNIFFPEDFTPLLMTFWGGWRYRSFIQPCVCVFKVIYFKYIRIVTVPKNGCWCWWLAFFVFNVDHSLQLWRVFLEKTAHLLFVWAMMHGRNIILTLSWKQLTLPTLWSKNAQGPKCLNSTHGICSSGT